MFVLKLIKLFIGEGNMNFNQIILAGYLVRDPELSYIANQTAVANFDVATNYKRGEREETCFAHCVAFGNIGETIVKYLTKGQPIFIIGRLTQDRWEAKDGSKRSKMKITVTEFRFVRSSGGQKYEKTQEEEWNPQENEDEVFK